MSKETVLKKEFKESDIQRLRNLVSGKLGDATKIQSGFEVSDVRSEGDVWTDKSGTWTIKDGIKQSVTKMDSIKNSVHLPLFCPQCKSKMTPRIDRGYYNQHKMCLSCVVKMEDKIKLAGGWEQYENSIHNDHINKLIQEYTNWYEEEKRSKDTIITEQGKIEEWRGDLTNKLDEEFATGLEFLKSQLR